MDTDIKISIIVPVYNLMHEIPRCINSIINQTYSNLEIIIVDDGSTDDSWKAIQEFTDQRIIAIHQENKGVTAARVNGIKRASGGFIGFVDGDDEIERDMYELLCQNARKYEADISQCGYQMIFPDGRIHYFHNTEKFMVMEKEQAVKELLSGEKIEPGLCNKIYRKSLWDKILLIYPIDPEIKINEDLLLNYYLFANAKVNVFFDKCKYHYLIRENSASRQKLNIHKILDPIKVKEIILDNSEQEWEKDAQRAYLSTSINVFNAIVCNGGRQYRKEQRKIFRDIRQAKEWSVYLRKRQKVLYFLMTKLPRVYTLIYRFYNRFLQHSVYQ